MRAAVQSGTVTAEDIDAIIAKGVRDTEQLNKKLQEFSKDAMKFTMVHSPECCDSIVIYVYLRTVKT